jgi:hypothetical protein
MLEVDTDFEDITCHTLAFQEMAFRLILKT